MNRLLQFILFVFMVFQISCLKDRPVLVEVAGEFEDPLFEVNFAEATLTVVNDSGDVVSKKDILNALTKSGETYKIGANDIQGYESGKKYQFGISFKGTATIKPGNSINGQTAGTQFTFSGSTVDERPINFDGDKEVQVKLLVSADTSVGTEGFNMTPRLLTSYRENS